jgi:putative transposase
MMTPFSQEMRSPGNPGRFIFSKDGLFDELKLAVAERALNAEMDHHLDGEAGDGWSNSRNGYGKKTVLTDSGKLDISVPRDRLSTFDPQLIAKYRRRLPGFDEKIVSPRSRLGTPVA